MPTTGERINGGKTCSQANHRKKTGRKIFFLNGKTRIQSSLQTTGTNIFADLKSPNRQALQVEKKVALINIVLLVRRQVETIAHEHCTCITRCTLPGLMSRADPANVVTWKNLSPASRDPGNRDTRISANQAGPVVI